MQKTGDALGPYAARAQRIQAQSILVPQGRPFRALIFIKKNEPGTFESSHTPRADDPANFWYDEQNSLRIYSNFDQF